MLCKACSRTVLTLFLREAIGIHLPRTVSPTRQALRPSRNIRFLHTTTPRAIRGSSNVHTRISASQSSTVPDDEYIPFDKLSLLTPELADLPIPFAPPPPPEAHLDNGTDETSWIGRQSSAAFEPEVKLEGNLENEYLRRMVPVEDETAETLNSGSGKWARKKERIAQRIGEVGVKKWEKEQNPKCTVFKVEEMTKTHLESELESPKIKEHSRSRLERLEKWKEERSAKDAAGKVETQKNGGPGKRKEYSHSTKPRSTEKTSSYSAAPKDIKTITREKATAQNAKAPASLPPKRHGKEAWQVQKAALDVKFGEKAWLPPKRLSPDALEGIRALHAQYPDQFTTPVLADHFKVSPEAIRRILKSRWRPNAEEEEERRERWEKRGEQIWKALVEKGEHAPKRWREIGIGAGGPRKGRPEWLKMVREKDEELERNPVIARKRGDDEWGESLAGRIL